MTTRPRLRLGSALLPGVLAVALFGLIALATFAAEFEAMLGFPDGITVTAEIGYALLDLTALQSTEGAIAETETFLAAFFLAAIALDAALDASLVLAKREEAGEPVTALSSTEARADSSSGAESDDAGATGPGPAATDGGERA